jgi:hypothetical protein
MQIRHNLKDITPIDY